MKKNAGIQQPKSAGSTVLRTETSKNPILFCKVFVLFIFLFSFTVDAQLPVNTVPPAAQKTGVRRFTIRTESKSFEKTKFRKLSEAKAAVEKYRRGFNSRVKDLQKRCQNYYGEGYTYSGISIKPRAIGYMNEDLPIDKFSWKRLIAEVYIECIKPE